MAVTTEFKKTDIGDVPTDWTVEKLGPHVKIISGESPSKFKFWDQGLPYFKVEQLNNNNKYLRDTPYFIGHSKNVPKGSLIFPKRGASILLNKIRLLDQDSFMDTNLMTLTPDEFFDREYLFYALINLELWRIADTTSIPQINNKHIVPILLPRPPAIAEQKAIAATIGNVDTLIESLETLIEKKKMIKQGVMQELLTGNRRLPRFAPAFNQLIKTDIGIIPSDWKVVELGHIGEPIIGLTYKPADVHDSGILVLRSSNIQNDNLEFRNNVHVKMKVPKKVITQEGDLLICVRNGSRHLIGKCALIDGATAGAAFGAFMSIFRTKHSPFILFSFRSGIVKSQINEVLGATINQITNKDLKSFKIALPPNERGRKGNI